MPQFISEPLARHRPSRDARFVLIPALALVLLLGSALRIVPLVGTDFPLNDGGLFLTMATDLRANAFALPAYASYNDLPIPYAYPPLGFYLTALLEVAGNSGLDVLRLVPALASITTIPVVWAIGREVFRSDTMSLATAAFFAVSTGSYEWLVLGGGITRAPGFLLALVAILFAIRAYRRDGRLMPIVSGVALGATGLWHPQAAVFAAVSVVLVLPFTADDRRRALVNLAVAATIAAIVVLPWLAIVVARHGLDPLLSAVGTGGTPFLGLLSLVTSKTSAGHLEVLGVATTLGLIVCMLRGVWLAPVWMIAIAMMDSRAGQPYLSVPAAMAVAFLVRDVGSVARHHIADVNLGERWAPVALRTGTIIGVVFFVAAFADSVAAQTAPDSPLRAMPNAERDAMAWVTDNTETDASFVVVSGRYWAMDAASEWFPILAQRRSLNTVQGYEWLGADRFAHQRDRAGVLAPCVAASDLDCVDRWFEDAGEVDYLFLTRSPVAVAAGLDCCLELAEQMKGIRSAVVVYTDPAVTIVRLSP